MLVTPKVHVTHVITGLQVGGAERLLALLLGATDTAVFEHDVVVLTQDGPVGDEVRALGVPVHVLGMSRAGDLPAVLLRLVQHLRRHRPDVVHTWMVHANALGGLAARATGVPTLWSLHHSDLAKDGVRRSTRALESGNALLSRLLADLVVTTSTTAGRRQRRSGYPQQKLLWIPNAAAPTTIAAPVASGRLRAELGLGPDAVLVGRVGRLAPQKDYGTFFAAAGTMARTRPDVHVVCAGRGVDATSSALRALVDDAGLDGRCSLLGERSDAALISAAVDVAVSSSAFGETTPLVLMEALAAGTPVVTTDVGDCADLVGPGGCVVPPRDAPALAAALGALVDASPEERQRIGARGQTHVQARGGVSRLARDYEAAYRRVTAGR